MSGLTARLIATAILASCPIGIAAFDRDVGLLAVAVFGVCIAKIWSRPI